MEKLHEQPDDPLIGCTLPGGHVVLELIDVGGMGRVYRAEQKMLGRTVAVKIIHPHLLGDETVEARFITEARAASQLNHPNSVGVIDFGKFEGRLYMVMEFLRGRDLATVAHEEGPLEPERILDIMTQTLAALEEAHHNGIVHRDLKPENIVLAPLRSGGDFVKVLDFGLAKVLQQARNKRITDPGMVCGTPEYMAPEQARGDDVDHRADLYACGVLLFELLTGQLPFDGASPREVVLMHLSTLPPDPRTVAPDRGLWPEVVDVVMSALAKSPAERPATASAFAAALKDAFTANKRLSRRAEGGVKCPACDSPMPANQKFCGECGTSLTQLPPESVPPFDSLPSPASSSAPSDEATFPLPFVGRDDELGWLFERRDAAAKTLVSCALVGHAGMGKTRLLDEFSSAAGGWGDVVVVVRPDPWWCEKGYFALRDAIRQLADLPDDGGDPSQWPGASPEVRAGLSTIFERAGGNNKGDDQTRSWVETPPLATEQSERRQLSAEALRWALGRAQDRAKEGQVILAIDDFHAVDGASRNAFNDVVAEPPLLPALIVGAYRPSFKAGWDEHTEVLDVRGLPTAIASSLLGDDVVVPDNTGGEIATDGPSSLNHGRVSPLYVEHMLRFMQEGFEDPPNKLADMIALRIERLAAEARRVLQAVAVLGDTTRSAQLVSLLPDIAELSKQMNVLNDAGLVSIADGIIATSHPLVRDVTLASTPHAVLRGLHGRARRDVGVDHPSAPIEANALHAYHADESFEALMLLERVALARRDRDDAAGAVASLHLALNLARREMARGELDDPEAAVLMFSRKLGDALVLDGKATDAEGILAEALNLAGPVSPERSRILASLANIAQRAGRPDTAYQRLDEALAIAERGNHPTLLATLEQMRSRWVAGV